MAPYGYRRVPRTPTTPAPLAIHEPPAAMGRPIVAGHAHTGGSPRRIAHEWTRRAIPAPKGGALWSAPDGRRILHHAADTGTWTVNRRRASGESGAREEWRPASAWIALTVPPVIDAETVHRSPPRPAENPRFRPRNLQAESRWRLRGVARWGRCGQALITVRNPTGRSRDRFTSDYRYRHPRDPLTPCPGPYRRAEALDDRVWADVAHLLTHPAILRQAVEEGAVVSTETPVIQTQQAAVERQLAMARRERTRLLDAYQAGLRERADLHQRVHPLDLRLQQGEAEATRLAVWEHEAAGEEDLVRRLDR